ncbi:hypothetical protein DFP72DRAFT_1122988 [Ephemerocybe angulata]|uniref:Uncharacterized protein n=1 Tax=Ephemerocybe angulata TaxID=980116 RepID=A0A8H6M703_9AGAR|nr:hypothetical protein DFP72DRAFT_1122988 [Tulosesus angulatus]
MDVTETGPATKFHALPPSSRGITRESSLSTLPRSPSPDTTPEVDSTSFAAYRGRVDSACTTAHDPRHILRAASRYPAYPHRLLCTSGPRPLSTVSIYDALYPPPPALPTPPPPPPPQQPKTVTFAASVSTRAAPTATATTPITSRIPPIVDHLLSEIDEVREALEAEREMRRLGDVEVRKLRDEIAEMRRMVKERVGRR